MKCRLFIHWPLLPSLVRCSTKDVNYVNGQPNVSSGVGPLLGRVKFRWKYIFLENLLRVVKKWNHLMYWTWGIFQIFIWSTLTAIFFMFLIPGPLYKSEKKFFRLWGLWYSKRPAWTHGFNAKIGFEKYAPIPEILSKTSQKSGRQTKPA